MVAGVVGDGWQQVGVFRRSDRHQVVRGGGGGGWSMCRSCSGHQWRSNRCHLGAATGAGSPVLAVVLMDSPVVWSVRLGVSFFHFC